MIRAVKGSSDEAGSSERTLETIWEVREILQERTSELKLEEWTALGKSRNKIMLREKSCEINWLLDQCGNCPNRTWEALVGEHTEGIGAEEERCCITAPELGETRRVGCQESHKQFQKAEQFTVL